MQDLRHAMRVLAVSAGLIASTAHAGLTGDSVTLRYDTTGQSSTFDTVTVGSGVEITCTGSGTGNGAVCGYLTAQTTQTIDFADLSITYTYAGDGAGFGSAAFNGFNFLGLDAGFPIGSVVLSTNIAGLDSSRITVGPDFISVNMQNLGVPGPESTFTLTLAPVPEPETWAMLLAGLAGVGALARRKRHA